MTLLKENQTENNKSGITFWKQVTKDIKETVTVLVLDDKGKPRSFDKIISPINNDSTEAGHKTNVCGLFRQCSPCEYVDINNPYQTRIIAINFFKEKERAIQYILEHANEIDVINCSFSSPSTTDLDSIKSLNIPIIASSGNNGNLSKYGVSNPASEDYIIGNGAFEERSNSVENYSNGGEELDIVSFTDIYIPLNEQGTDTLMFNGTSASSPYSNSMLLYYILWRKHLGLPKITDEQAETFVCKHTIDLLDKGFDWKSGFGLYTLPKKIIELTIGENEVVTYRQNERYELVKEQSVIDVVPMIFNNRTLVPLRMISETLSYKVEWLNETRQVIIDGISDKIIFDMTWNPVTKQYSNVVDVNGNKIVTDVPPTIVGGRTLVPIRMIAEHLKCTVEWTTKPDGSTDKVYILK